MDPEEANGTDTNEPLDRKEMLMQQFDEVAQPTEEPIAAATDTPTEAPEPEVEEPVWKRPPSSWKKEFHETWQTADPRLQEYAWQREEEMRKGVEPLLSKAQYADQMQKAMEPYMQTIQGLGVAPTDAVKALMEADHILRHSPQDQKQAYLAQLAQQYGVNMGGVNFSQNGPVDPTIYALQNELNAVRGEVVGWKQRQEEAQNESLRSEIDSFAQGAEHFETVRPTMIQLLNTGVVNTLEEAYEKAIRLDDDLFKEVQQSRQAEMEAEKRETANRAAKAAKAAAVSVKSSTPGVRTTTKAQDRRSMLLEQFNDMNERF